MERTDALKRMLEDMTRHYNGGEKVPVEFDTSAYAHPDGYVTVAPNVRDAIGKSLSGPEELKVVCDTLCHEVEHVRESDLEGKRNFMKRYPKNFQKVAGLINNIVEDQFVDANRLSRFKGLRHVHEFTNEAVISNDHRHPKIDDMQREQQFVAGMLQIHIAGYAKGYEDADDDVKTFLAWYRRHLGTARRTYDPMIRDALSARIADNLLELWPDPPEGDSEGESGDGEGEGGEGDSEPMDVDELEEWIDDMADDAQLELPHEDEPGIGDDPLELTDEAKERLAEMIEDGDIPDELIREAPAAEGLDESGEEIDADSEPAGEGDGEIDDGDSDPAGVTDEDDGDREGGSEGDGGDDASEGGSPGSDDGDRDEPETAERGRPAQGTLTEGDQIATEIETLEGGESTASWFDETADDDVDPSTWERRYDRLIREIQRDKTDNAERRRERDEILAEGGCGPHNESGEDIRQYLRETGLAREVVEAFRKVKTAPTPKPTEAGDRLHLRNYVRFRAGDTSERNLYETTEISELGGRGIGVTLDMSGSMNSSEKPAKAAVGALALAAQEIDDEFVANAFFTPGGTRVRTTAITTPNETFDWEHLDAVWPQANDPITYGMQECVDMLEDLAVNDRVMFVVTDGRPTLTSSGGVEPDKKNSRDAVQEAAEYVRRVRAEHGITVIGLGVGHGVNPGLLEKIFGTDGYVHCEVNEMADALLKAYTTQLDVAPDL